MKIDHYLSNITLEFHYFRFQGEYKKEAGRFSYFSQGMVGLFSANYGEKGGSRRGELQKSL